MLNWSTEPCDSLTFLEALPGKLDIKKHSPSILHIQDGLVPESFLVLSL